MKQRTAAANFSCPIPALAAQESSECEEEFPGQTEQFEAAMQAAASITAENDIASKALGSMDPLDHSSGQ